MKLPPVPIRKLACPKNPKEAADIAAAVLRVDVQHMLYTLMREKGVSQKAVASALGISPATVRRMLSSYSNPSLKRLAQVASVLGVELEIVSRPSIAQLSREPE